MTLDVDWKAVEQEYTANVLTKAEIARKYEISYQALYGRAKRNNWVQMPKAERASAVKKRLVEEALSLGKKGQSTDEIIEEAVDQDVEDMGYGLRNARKALELSHKGMEQLDGHEDGINPMALKSYMDSTKLSVEVIRKIRGLDDKDNSEDEIEKASYDDLIAEIESLTRAD